MRIPFLLAALCALALAGGADQARSLLDKGEFQKAAEAARKLADKDPGNIDAWVVLSDAHLGLDEPASAWEVLEPAIAKNPDAVPLLVKLGDVFAKMAEKEQRTSGDGTTITNYYLDAQRMYDEALAKDAKSAPAMYGKAYVNFYMDKKDLARKYVADCLGLDGNYGKAHALQGYLFYTDGIELRQNGDEDRAKEKFRVAQERYETALKLDKSDVFDFVRYGHCHYALGEMDAARDAYIAGLKQHPRNDAPIKSGLYNVAGRDWSKAVSVLQLAVKEAPDSPHAWFYLGYGHFLNNAFGDAKKAFEHARALDESNALYVFYAGYVQEREGDGDAALDLYRTALQLAPNYLEAAGRFEALLLTRRDIDAMEKLYEELLELAPTYGWGQNNYALLLRDWSEQRGAAKTNKLPADVARRLKRSGEVYEMAAQNLPTEAQVQSDTGLLFEFYPANRDDEKALKYFTRALDISEYTYRDAFAGLDRLCRRAGRWDTLKDYAEGVLGALEDQGKHAIAPVGGGAPRELPHETPRMVAKAKLAIKDADAHLAGG